MYLWNGIRIEVKGSNENCIIGLSKYLNAVYDHEYEGECDLSLLLMDEADNAIPRIPTSANKIKSMLLNLDTDIRMDVFTFETQLWYVYSNHVSLWMDYKANILIVSIKTMPYTFEYFNILTFILHPLGTLLEGFGFFRLHGSCAALAGRSVLFTGMDGNGKSTSAFAIATHGGSIISDNLTFVKKEEDGYKPYALTKLVKLSLESVNAYFPELTRVHSATFDSGEIYYFLDDINAMKPESSSISNIMLTEKLSSSLSSCKSLSSSGVLPMMFPTGIHTSIEEHTRMKFLFVSDMLESTEICSLSLGTDINEFVHMIRNKISP
ncbi:MAG: hypothetical protein JXN10_01545 [Clostridia bacterium]|nr:hypothetical protein [Clostridia bacterium]MBN2882185.1 hypothetical protein [Clostridia bacterium]